MHSLEYIDSYFKGEFSSQEKMEFERKMVEDPSFADDVAFYISTRQVSKDLVIEEKKNNFRKIYSEYNKEAKVFSIRRIWSYAAAAVVVFGMSISWFLFTRQATPTQMAEQYIKENLNRLPVNMGGRQDSLQMGVNFFNEGKLSEGQAIFEAMVAREGDDDKALEYAGETALKQQDYQKAIQYFNQLEKIKLEYNPGKFYHALTLMSRNGTGDAPAAKKLLQEVVNEGLAKKEDAEKLLKSL